MEKIVLFVASLFFPAMCPVSKATRYKARALFSKIRLTTVHHLLSIHT